MNFSILFRFLSLLTLASTAGATSFYIQPLSKVTLTVPNMARVVITNIRVENAITNEGGKTIYTYANGEVKEVIKGGISDKNILIRKVGGTKDGVTLDIPSSVEFTEGEECVLFLSDLREDHAYEVLGMELGKYGLKDENGERVLTGGIFNYSHPERETDGHSQAAADLRENQHPWTLKQLKELVKKQAKAPAATSAADMIAKNEITPNTPASLTSPTEAPLPTSEKQTEETARLAPRSSPFFRWLIVGALAIAAGAYFSRKQR